MSRLKLLNKLYEKNSSTNNYIIKISISDYTTIFNDLDPSPLRKRDLDYDFVYYIEDCSSDIPLKYSIEFHIFCPAIKKRIDKEERVKAGIKNYCNYMMLTTQYDLNKSIKSSILYIVIFVSLMLLTFTLSPFFSLNPLTETLQEGMFIGGWVFSWEAIANIFFKDKKLRNNYKKYKRLGNANVTFVYQ